MQWWNIATREVLRNRSWNELHELKCRPAKTNIQEYVSASAYYLQFFDHYNFLSLSIAL